jgi:heptosyltransferase-2
MPYSLDKFSRVIVIQTAFLGDVVLTLPLLQKIKDKCPNSELILITTKIASTLAESCKAVDKVVIYDKRGSDRGWKGIKEIAGRFNDNIDTCVISAHRSYRSSLLQMFIKPRLSVCFDNTSLKFLYKRKIKYYNHLHEIDRNLFLLKAFNLEFSETSLSNVPLEFRQSDNEFVDKTLLELGIDLSKPLIALAPGSVWETKRWKDYHYSKLSQMIINSGAECITIGAAQDEELCKTITEDSGCKSVCGRFSLPQTLIFLKKCRLLVSNDSAPVHFAGLVNCPVIAIYGPTSPIFGFSPRGNKDVVLYNEELFCSPCRIHGGKKCPIGTHVCMTSITPEMVYDGILKTL